MAPLSYWHYFVTIVHAHQLAGYRWYLHLHYFSEISCRTLFHLAGVRSLHETASPLLSQIGKQQSKENIYYIWRHFTPSNILTSNLYSQDCRLG